MNSVSRHLGVANKAATLLAMRSAKKEIILVVEGDADVGLISNVLGMPPSNLLACGGKEVLMGLFELPPQKGLDEGMIFLRDRDCENICSREKSGILLLVTNRYDVEMELLENRIFALLIFEFSRGKVDNKETRLMFSNVCEAAGVIGAVRLYSFSNGARLDFDELKFGRFLDRRMLSINIRDFINYIFAKSRVVIQDYSTIESEIQKIIQENESIGLGSGKDAIELLHILLSRRFNHGSAECSAGVLARMIRVASNLQDARTLSFYPKLKQKVASNAFEWAGASLDA